MIQFALGVSLVLNVCLSLVVLKIALDASAKLSESHERTTKHTEGLVDRLMANDYGTWHDRKLVEDTMQPARAPLPDDPEDDFDFVRGPDRGGFGSRLGLVALSTPDEEMHEELAARGEL